MEIEALVGAVQELGRLTDLPTPTIDAVLALVRLRARAGERQAIEAAAAAPETGAA